ncbi:protoporphyrinogen oxidase, chloroplastic/mitochondrial isoform X2 [Amborella trichopoda]|uniref:protoporphyrinogen oxidase, chloroplastic/mitochondrial isoform X2 n=1 Tax=Amborella trichopoda TaxID=13333 RepID=UPI0009BE2727|nr:protoporphyrinogen oxidase, chloroplastic/mitochondrial isoform X2 [Amborella trichopoda]|eukprot:XP_020523315.1 protoporphyrinogen oxidase, chloroplastic/mitochondrial isoform X2 [Amborella trichopoda]
MRDVPRTPTESEMEVKRLIDDLGLREKQQFPISQNKRFIARNGTPVLIPSNPLALFGSKLLSPHSKLRVILEPLFWRSSNRKGDISKVSDQNLQESVGDFFQRHFGQEVVDYLVDPFVAGTSAADPNSLSMRHAFPEILNLERRFGSILVGVIKSKMSSKGEEKGKHEATRRKPKHQRGSFSFQGGLQTLTDKLAEELGNENVKLHSKVLSLSYGDGNGDSFSNWSVSYIKNQSDQRKLLLKQSFDAVVMTAPIRNMQEMQISKCGKPYMLDFLPNVMYLPLSIIVTTFKKENVKLPLEGFGVLVPSKEQGSGLRTLGTLFSSMMFPDRAPKDQYLYTTFVGGSRNRNLASASLDELREVVTCDLKKLLGVVGAPTFVRHVYWGDAFPLYGHNYDMVLKAIEKMEQNLPGFFYAGNHRGGLSVGKSIASGWKAAELVLSHLNVSQSMPEISLCI